MTTSTTSVDRPDRDVVDHRGRHIGRVAPDGRVLTHTGVVIGTARDGVVRDHRGVRIGQVTRDR